MLGKKEGKVLHYVTCSIKYFNNLLIDFIQLEG